MSKRLVCARAGWLDASFMTKACLEKAGLGAFRGPIEDVDIEDKIAVVTLGFEVVEGGI